MPKRARPRPHTTLAAEAAENHKRIDHKRIDHTREQIRTLYDSGSPSAASWV